MAPIYNEYPILLLRIKYDLKAGSNL